MIIRITKKEITEMAKNGVDITKLDVSHITDMYEMFTNADLFNQPLDNWNVSNVTGMRYMFAYAMSFNQDINTKMVRGVASLNNQFSEDIKNESGISPVANRATEQTSFTQSEIAMSTPPKIVAAWNVSNVNHTTNMFEGAESFKQYIGDWFFNEKCEKPFMNTLTFDIHNKVYLYTYENLTKIVSIYSNMDDADKYKSNIFIKQFQEFDLSLFNYIINELKSKSNSGKEFFDEIS